VASRKTPTQAGAASTKSVKSGKSTGKSTSSSKPGKATKRQSARDRIAAQRAAERRRERQRWFVMFAAVGIVVAALGAGTVWAVTKQDRDKQKSAQKSLAAHENAMPPWPVPADPVAGARAAGLTVQPMEGTAKHFHTHLDILVNGRPVEVPANLGISQTAQAMSELHTHDTTGVLHIESPTTSKRYNLGELFRTWQVKLSGTAMGGLRTNGTNTLVAYVDGKKQTGDPASIELTAHREIALVYGPAGAKVNVPKAYKFPQGE
jgi:hypothetical protein